MKLWMKRIAVALIAILTLGIYTPTYLIAEAEDDNEFISPEKEADKNKETISEVSSIDDTSNIHFQLNDELDYRSVITEQAMEQTIAKLGPRIVHKVEDDFTEIILPSIEQTIEELLANVEEDQLPFYGITEQPSEGYGERIFHLYDYSTDTEVARFHVRRDNRPQEGYWFNFHYHLNEDQFEEHHTIGEIYWDKNTPPKWMA